MRRPPLPHGGGRGALSVSQYGRLLYTEAIARDLYPLTRFQDRTTPPRQHQGHLTISLLIRFLNDDGDGDQFADSNNHGSLPRTFSVNRIRALALRRLAYSKRLLKGRASRFPVEAIYNRFDESYCFTCRFASYLNIPVYSFVA